MIGSLFDKSTMKKFDDLAKKQARLNEKKNGLVKNAMEEIDPETLKNVLDVVKKYGHPEEQKTSKEIENKYTSGERLEFDDLMNLDHLYKSNLEKFSKKGCDHE